MSSDVKLLTEPISKTKAFAQPAQDSVIVLIPQILIFLLCVRYTSATSRNLSA